MEDNKRNPFEEVANGERREENKKMSTKNKIAIALIVIFGALTVAALVMG